MSSLASMDPVPVWLGAAPQSFLPPRLEADWCAALGPGWGPARLRGAPAWSIRVGLKAGGWLEVGGRGLPMAEVTARLEAVFAGVGLAASGEGLGFGDAEELSGWAEGGRAVWLGARAEVVRALWGQGQPAATGWPAVVGALALPVVVEVGRRALSLEGVGRLRVGEVLVLGPREEGFSLRVGGIALRRVVPVRREGRLGCRVVDGGP